MLQGLDYVNHFGQFESSWYLISSCVTIYKRGIRNIAFNSRMRFKKKIMLQGVETGNGSFLCVYIYFVSFLNCNSPWYR